MAALKPESARALAWSAGILIVLALVIMSPTGALALLALAGLCAAVPTIFGAGRPRIASAVLLVASAALAATFYPAFEKEREGLAERAKQRAVKQPVPANPEPAIKKGP